MTFEEYMEVVWSRYERLVDRHLRNGANSRGAESLAREAIRDEYDTAARINNWLSKKEPK